MSAGGGFALSCRNFGNILDKDATMLFLPPSSLAFLQLIDPEPEPITSMPPSPFPSS